MEKNTTAKILEILCTHRAAGVVIVALLGLRAASELGMMGAYGTDAQLGIWAIFMGVALAIWAATAFICLRLATLIEGRWSSLLRYALLFCWALAICGSSWKYLLAWDALADAANPSASSDRLRQLATFDGIQAGYELDNRLASNPNTPADVLRLLATRDQLGTKMCLARNPHAPEDVLQQLSHESDGLIQESLKLNPNHR